jgi:putative ABC transport system permease protein
MQEWCSLYRFLVPRTGSAEATAQGLALGLTGFTLGALLVLAVKDYFPRRVVLEADNALTLFGIVFVVCILSSGLGVRAALRVDPATALGS